MLEEPNELRCVAGECIKTEVQPEDDIRLSSQPQRAHVTRAVCSWPLFSPASSVAARECRSNRNKHALQSHNYVSVLAQITSARSHGKTSAAIATGNLERHHEAYVEGSQRSEECLASIIRSQAGPAAQSQQSEAFWSPPGPRWIPIVLSRLYGGNAESATCRPRYCGTPAPELNRSMASKSRPSEGSD